MRNTIRIPLDKDRQRRAEEIRNRAASKSRNEDYSGRKGHLRNNSEVRYSKTLVDSFTKGLGHKRRTGVIDETSHFDEFVDAINDGGVELISKLRLGGTRNSTAPRFKSAMATPVDDEKETRVRGWESMAAGLTFSLEGADAQALTMPPAPSLESSELAFEMTELYWMAVLRDMPFEKFDKIENRREPLIEAAIRSLNRQEWAKLKKPKGDNDPQFDRLPPHFDIGNVFRGRTEGDSVGPYLSQFLLIGTPALGDPRGRNAGLRGGLINYGSIRIDQRVRVAKEGLDYMTTWEAWLDVQNGADVRGRETYENVSGTVNGKEGRVPKYRFITTPRDLATYVHYDALYEAYLNACMIMLALKFPFDEGLPFTQNDWIDKQTGFATFGGPHILTLVTEVATRALKVARFQKFNVHRRPRPEAIAALIDGNMRQKDRGAFDSADDLVRRVDDDVLDRISDKNRRLNNNVRERGEPKLRRSSDYDPVNENSKDTGTYLLPMAFAEGSPMHPSYGAGHATVAAACVTVLKAFFNHKHRLNFAFVPSADGESLKSVDIGKGQHLTVEGELNKLCSNISVGRNWAGVHWYSDYHESIKVGEELALSILREQKLTYNEDFEMTVPLFSGEVKKI